MVRPLTGMSSLVVVPVPDRCEVFATEVAMVWLALSMTPHVNLHINIG